MVLTYVVGINSPVKLKGLFLSIFIVFSDYRPLVYKSAKLTNCCIDHSCTAAKLGKIDWTN